jgi:ElaB/YqjD/DUF883 family membrane-anchored ribosome-binding protein
MNGDSTKDPRQLEREVDEQRRQIGETMHALEQRFAPEQIYSQAAGYLRSHGGEFAENFGRSIKANPLPVALTAVGLAWMMFGQRQPADYRAYERPYRDHDVTNDLYGNSTSIYGHKAGEGGSGESRSEQLKGKAGELKGKGSELKHRGAEMGHNLKDRMSSARDHASATGHDLRDRASSTGQQLRGSARHARDGLSHGMESARSNFEHYMREQPLAMGAIGIALGALVGASLPRTRTEHQMMGSVSERARNKASSMAQEGYQKASEMGESVSHQAKEALDSQRRPEQRPPSTGAKTQGPSATP